MKLEQIPGFDELSLAAEDEIAEIIVRISRAAQAHGLSAQALTARVAAIGFNIALSATETLLETAQQSVTPDHFARLARMFCETSPAADEIVDLPAFLTCH